MDNFNFYNPVKILFGKNKINELGEQIPENSNVLILYGKESIKKNGIYDKVKLNLQKFNTFEFSGIEANPTYETCIKAFDIIKKNNIDFLLAVGGGSVIDATKFIASAIYFTDTDPWDILIKKAEIKKAMPIGTILTLPATGSEMNGNAVITKQATTQKISFTSPLVLPKFSILDPEYTYSLPKHQIANGIIDAFIHVTEQYLTYPNNTPLQDRFAEGILLTLIEETPEALNSQTPNYENRANIMWSATMALNGLLSAGVKPDWATHQIGHELTALYGLDHAVTLVIILPGLLKYKQKERKTKLLQYAERVWNIKNGTDDEKIILAIDKTEEFFIKMGIKTRLSDYNITKDVVNIVPERLNKRGLNIIGAQQDFTTNDVKNILEDRF
jgi:NADP-dependent alcohol dehydrogenase